MKSKEQRKEGRIKEGRKKEELRQREHNG